MVSKAFSWVVQAVVLTVMFVVSLALAAFIPFTVWQMLN